MDKPDWHQALTLPPAKPQLETKTSWNVWVYQEEWWNTDREAITFLTATKMVDVQIAN